MRQVDSKAFEKVKIALSECLVTNTNLAGLKIVPPKPEDCDFENAATIALMSLCKDWVRPSNVSFSVGDGKWL